ncbi:MAG TPA: glycoside hydrolase family 20 zincin-like fold domain-containing protein [Phycisphaerae bacterium]|nr:glycoside hydrolase family 20 zincin-like fold domain-containing protein [Phycisphaerae bacterium]
MRRHRLPDIRSRLLTSPAGLPLAMVALVGLCAADAATAASIEAGPVVVEYAPRPAGMRITWDGVTVSSHSELIVTTPPWAPHFYVGPSEEAVATARRSAADGVQTLEIDHRGSNDTFIGTERLTLRADGTLEQVLEGRFAPQDGAALVQWRAAALNPSVFMGRKFRAELPDGTVDKGVFPITPQPEKPPIARGFRRLDVESRLGPIRIEVVSDSPLVLYDHRAGRWSNPEDPFYWFGDLGTRIHAGQPVKYQITYTFPPAPADSAAPRKILAELPVTKRSAALTSRIEGTPHIVPRPKEMHVAADTVALGALPPADDDATDAAAPWRLARQELLRYWRSLDPAASTAPAESPRLEFEQAAPGDLPPEGYRLSVNSARIAITAADAHGFLYGIQTLKQLSWRNDDGHIEIRQVDVNDWPSLAYRGVHIFTGGQGPDLHEQLVRNLYAPCKLNEIVLESEYVEWDAFPEIHHPEYGMSKADVRRILETCHAVGIEVTPLVQSLGHCQWMFYNGAHLDLAEDPDAAWAYCVTNPKTYDFIFTVYAEALELFKPRALHIGHDEYADRGRVPYREASKQYSVDELFMMDTLKLHDWLGARHVQTMMWGDMLLAKGEAPDACNAKSPEDAAHLRAQLPDDITITDWHYVTEPPEKYGSLAIFEDAGHPTIAATWYRPGNIIGFAQAAYQQKALGLLQTTWAGYSLDPASFTKELRQYIAHVLAAEAAWNADRDIDLDLLGAGEAFFRMMGMSALPRGTRTGWTADLTKTANVDLAAQGSDGWFGLGPEHDLSALPAGDVRLEGVDFKIAGASGAGRGLALAGKLARVQELPRSATLRVDAETRALVLLVTTEFSCRTGTRIATAHATFADGETTQLDLIYGKNIFASTDLTPSADAPVMWRGQNKSGQAVAVRAAVWALRSQRHLTGVELTSANAPASFVLLGVTGLIDASENKPAGD